VLAIPLWSTKVAENVGLVDTCTRYEVAPFEAFQIRSAFVATSVAPFTGELSVGGDGTLFVVKLRTLDQALVPPAFVALTRQ
jgi:hypothetical protein